MVNWILWIVAIIVFLCVEAATYALVSIWFAFGAVAALLVSFISDSISLQILVFLLVSLVCIAFLRKVAVKHFKMSNGETNLDRIVGKTVVIKETVDNLKGLGSAVINDVEWKVKSENGEILKNGEMVEIVKIEGVKLIVKRLEEE